MAERWARWTARGLNALADKLKKQGPAGSAVSVVLRRDKNKQPYYIVDSMDNIIYWATKIKILMRDKSMASVMFKKD